MTLSLTVAGVKAEALDVLSIELRAPDGGDLPPFSPGAHLEIDVRSGSSAFTRHYSLCSDSTDRAKYVIAVALPAAGRGGSAAVHGGVRIGSELTVRGPRNHFPLEPHAQHYRFVAGGIGITPILAMLRWCEEHGKSWSLLYCARSKLRAAFYEELVPFQKKGAVRFHFDDESPAHVPDLAHELVDPRPGEHVYCCGPSGLMRAVEAACSGRVEGTVHFEWFGADARAEPPARAGEFEVVLKRSGKRLQVPSDESVLTVLERHGVTVANSCREGVCGACETTVCAGVIDHRDHVLTKAEREANQSMLICVSRSKGSVIELDL